MAQLARKGASSIAQRSFPRRVITGSLSFHAVRVTLGRTGLGCRALVNSLRGVGIIGSAGGLLGTTRGLSLQQDSDSRLSELSRDAGLDSLFKVLAFKSSFCTSCPFAPLTLRPRDFVLLGLPLVSGFSRAFLSSRLMLSRAGVPRGVLSVELASVEWASVVFPFRVSVSEVIASGDFREGNSPKDWSILIGICGEPLCDGSAFLSDIDAELFPIRFSLSSRSLVWKSPMFCQA